MPNDLFYLQKLATPRQRFLTRLSAFRASFNGLAPHVHKLYSFSDLENHDAVNCWILGNPNHFRFHSIRVFFKYLFCLLFSFHMKTPESHSTSLQHNNPQITMAALTAGGMAFIPIGFFVAVFGAAFGVAATQIGLSQTSGLLMSTLVFAGAAQFGVLDLWGEQVSVLALVATVFAINARHILMGAVLYPHLQHLPAWKRYAMVSFVSDANWAISIQEFSHKKPVQAMGTLLGGGICLWLFWILGTGLGFYFGNAVAQPTVYGLDMVMACFLLSIALLSNRNADKNADTSSKKHTVKEGWQDPKTLTIWLVAAVSSMLAYLYLPENTNVIFAALVGGLVGVFMEDDDSPDDSESGGKHAD